MNLKESKIPFEKPLLWAVFVLYLIAVGTTITHHELWGDEFHSWNIAKASGSYTDLLSNIRYEGHPPFWYTILWLVSKLTSNVAFIQLVQFIIAGLVVFLVLFFSPYPSVIRILIPFGYFFLYEYGVFSRNYGIAVLLIFCICVVLNKISNVRLVLYYILLFSLSNTHLLALLAAASLHVFVLMSLREKKMKIFFHTVIGLVILLPSACFIFPPADSSLGTGYWLQRWNIDQLSVIVKAPVRAFIPVPAWWNYHFWNTEFLLELQYRWGFLRWIVLLLSSALLTTSLLLFRGNKKIFVFFVFFLGLVFIASIIIPFSNLRQTGFIFCGFLAAFWLYCYQKPITRFQLKVLTGLLIIQIIAAIISVSKEIKYPFSNSYYTRELVKQVPAGAILVTDYWCLNSLAAFIGKSWYCVDLQKETSFILWNSELTHVLNTYDPYSAGVTNLFNDKDSKELYMISILSSEAIAQRDHQLFRLYRIELIAKKEGAIERGSNVYLYRINK